MKFKMWRPTTWTKIIAGALLVCLTGIALCAFFGPADWGSNFIKYLGRFLFGTVLIPGAAICGVAIMYPFLILGDYWRAWKYSRKHGGKISDHLGR